MIEGCMLCPHKCGINRNKNKGKCKAGNKIEIGGVTLHQFEEPCISLEKRFRNYFLFKMQSKLCILPKL